MLITFTGT